MRTGNLRALSRLISWAENRQTGAEAVLAALYDLVGRAQVLGITGPPGAGKSTLISHFVRFLREEGRRVAVIAVDPVSPFTGGAILGDRIRLTEHFNDPGVFIRSLSTRGKLGGLSVATREVVNAVDAFGFDTIILETVGVGQSEVEVRNIADCTLVALVPEWGDGIQAIKAGILEIADVFCVHKSDRPGADRVATELRQTLQNLERPPKVLLSQEGDESSLRSLLKAMTDFVTNEEKLVKMRRAKAQEATLAELIESYWVEKTRAWASIQVSKVPNPYEGFLEFEKGAATRSPFLP